MLGRFEEADGGWETRRPVGFGKLEGKNLNWGKTGRLRMARGRWGARKLGETQGKTPGVTAEGREKEGWGKEQEARGTQTRKLRQKMASDPPPTYTNLE